MRLGTLACVPLRWRDQVRGLLYVDSRRRDTVLTEIDVEILEGLAEHASVVLGSLQLESRLRELLQERAEEAAGQRELLDELARRIAVVAAGGAG